MLNLFSRSQIYFYRTAGFMRPLSSDQLNRENKPFDAAARLIGSLSPPLFLPSHHRNATTRRSLSTLPRRDRRPRLKGLQVAPLNGLFLQSGGWTSALRELYKINQLGAAGLRDGDKKGEERAFSFSWACRRAQRGLITLSGRMNAGSHRPGLLFTIK